MGKVILAINAGSSSVKVSVFAPSSSSSAQPQELAVIQISGLTAPPASLKYDRGDEHIKGKELPDIKGLHQAFEYILDHLISDKGLSQLNDPEDVDFACHRVVHGGEYTDPVRIDRDTFHHLEALSDLAPLHNAGALDIVKAVHDKCPTANNVAFFDSAFHATIPEAVRTYAIDPEIARDKKLRKYGFHGLSYAFIARAVADHLAKPLDQANLIALHLGSGASACCIRHGKSVATSMGLTPLSGLPGATRSGDVDPSLIFHFTSRASSLAPESTTEMHITQAEQILNTKSGWAAMTGTTDFGQVAARAEKGDEKARLAFDVFVDRIVDMVASYYVRLRGEVDALVFAGGIGEKGSSLRRAVVERVACLGFEIDDGSNADPKDEVVTRISKDGGQRQVLICQTDEQTEMSRQCCEQADHLRK